MAYVPGKRLVNLNAPLLSEIIFSPLGVNDTKSPPTFCWVFLFTKTPLSLPVFWTVPCATAKSVVKTSNKPTKTTLNHCIYFYFEFNYKTMETKVLFNI